MRTWAHRITTLLFAAAIAGPASALTINLIDDGSVAGTPAQAGFAAAANYWQSVITTPVTVNIEVGYSDLGPGVLGGTSSALYTVLIEGVYGQLAANAGSALDALAVGSLAPLSPGDLGGFGSLSVITPGYVDVGKQLGIDNTTRVFDNDGSFNNSVIVGSGANLRALGYGVPAGSIDATIQFSNTFAFDFIPSDGINAAEYDFIGVAIHEIGHALGFLSGADDYDFLGCPSGPGCSVFADYPVNDDWWGYVGDLFRYSSDPTGVGPGGPQLDWAAGSPAYFSIDGGATAFQGGSFSTGTYNGDGWQASHWQQPGTCTGFLGIMNPYICNGFNDEITALDLAFFDAIGWNLSVDVLENPNYRFSTQQIPEPGTWPLLAAALGMLGLAARRRRTLPAA